MDIRQLEALLAVVEFGSFSSAAEALHTVQSNVSTRVSRLEAELGTQLIDRRTKELTTDGEAVAARARNIMNEMQSIPSDLAAMEDDIIGDVRIGVIASTARWLVSLVLGIIEVELPRVTLAVTEAPTSTILSLVNGNGLDAGVVSLPVDLPGVEIEPLFEEDVLLVTQPGHALAKQATVTPGELEGVPLILPPQNTPFRDELDFEFARHGLSLTPSTQVDGIRLIGALIVGGHDAGLLPATAVPDSDSVVGVPVQGINRRRVGLALPSNSSPSVPARAVIDIVRSAAQAGAASPVGVYLPNIETGPTP